MTLQSLSEKAIASPAPVVPDRGVVGIPQTIQQTVAREVVACSGEEPGNPSPAQVREAVNLVVAGVEEMQITRSAVIDARARSALGHRVVDAMRSEIMGGWRRHGIAETELPVMLLALERVREAVMSDGSKLFAAQLGAAALNLLIDVAHDMHSPLGSILFLAETLQRGESGRVSELQRHQLGLICTAALGLSSVGKDIMDLERSDLLMEPKPVPFSVMGVLESVRDIVRPIAEVKQLTVRVEPPARDERIGHPVALRRVLLNLTTNALKFTEHGFVDISTQESKPGWVEFMVRDSGRGIDPAMMPTLFDPVRRVAPSEYDARGRQLFSNTGLGLAICRKLAQAMGSELRVETQLGRGTRFFFELELPIYPSRRNSGPEHKNQATSAA
jgi:signal transduction histidine kinase